MPILKGRVVLHHTADGVVVEGRLTTEALKGLFYSDGNEKAEWFGAAQIHTFEGREFLAQVMEIYRFDDGSTITVKAEVAFTEDGSGTYSGDTTILGGTGRFAGVTGKGRLNGWSDGYNARHDVELDYKLP